MIVKTRYRDVEWEQSRCEHMYSPDPGKSAEVWRRIRGTVVDIDSETFEAGECSDCDTWLIVPRDIPNRCVTRGEIEIGD